MLKTLEFEKPRLNVGLMHEAITDGLRRIQSHIQQRLHRGRKPIAEIPQSLNLDQSVQTMLYESLDAEYWAFDERDVELLTGRENAERRELFYYPKVRAYADRQDELFAKYLPEGWNKTQHLFEPSESRWIRAAAIAEEIQNILHLGSPELGGIADCRAKSMFGLWEKTQYRFNLDPDEVFDGIGVRIMAKNTESARRMKQALLESFQVMQPHQFRHISGKTHIPVEDKLDSPSKDGFASIRMNLIHPELGLFELQIQTIQDYLRWRKHEKEVFASLAASPKYGLVVDPE